MNIEYLKKSIKKNDRFQKKNKKDTYLNNTLMGVVETFMKTNKRICYGGTAINSVLPKDKQFYDYDIDIPDYDFFSPNALEDAKKLCNLFKKENVFHVEGKNAVPYGTYKVFVNFVPVADCTQIDKDFYDYLLKYAMEVDGMLYTPPSFLRMSLHQELARPLGDVSRWEKIYERMNLLNIYHPIVSKPLTTRQHMLLKIKTNEFVSCYNTLFDLFYNEKNVFCNFHIVSSVFKKFFKQHKQLSIQKEERDVFFVYSDDLDNTIKQVNALKLSHIKIEKKESVYKFIDHYAYLYFKDKMIGFIFQTNSCLSYIETNYNNKKIRVGNVDTLINLYYSVILMDIRSLNHAVIISVLAELNKIVMNYTSYMNSNGEMPDVLERFNLPCYGIQDDFQTILRTRQRKYRELKKNKSSVEYKKWFFKYVPKLKINEVTTKNKTRKKKT